MSRDPADNYQQMQASIDALSDLVDQVRMQWHQTRRENAALRVELAALKSSRPAKPTKPLRVDKSDDVLTVLACLQTMKDDELSASDFTPDEKDALRLMWTSLFTDVIGYAKQFTVIDSEDETLPG